MQPPTAAPRDALTSTQVLTLIRDAPNMIVDCGLELINAQLQVVEDVSEWLRDGSVSRASYATEHGSCSLLVSTELDWGRAIVRPYMTISDGQITGRWNLGAYYTATPARGVAENPPTYEVAGYDIIHRLNNKVGASYSIETGQAYLAAATAILDAHGYTGYVVDQDAAAVVVGSTARVWELNDTTTWLNIVNECLAAVGYQGVWSDWDGRLRLQKYVSPAYRASEFTYTNSPLASMMDDDLVLKIDLFDAPNRWVAYRTNDIADAAPVEGAGIYTFTNQSDGPTSVDAVGRIITRPLPVEAATQAALVSRTEAAVAADRSLGGKLNAQTSPHPGHWHFDRITLDEPRLGPPMEMLSTQWTLPLRGENMTHEWSVL